MSQENSNLSVLAEQKMRRAREHANTTSSARDRVRGTGPDRKLLPAWKPLLAIPEPLVLELNQHFVRFCQVNHLASPETYQVSQHCPLRYATPEGFHHLLLTECPPDQDNRDEKNYTQWTKDSKALEFRAWMEEHFPGAFRVRLSLLKAHTEFSWHIDTNTSVACRCSASLNRADAFFEINERGTVQSAQLDLGQVVFTNTGWPHRVFNTGANDRLNLVFGIEFKNLNKYFQKDESGTFR